MSAPTPTPTAMVGEESSSPSASATAALSSLTTCMRSIVTTDLTYARCVMNSGLFALNETQPRSQFRNTSSEEGMLMVLLRAQLSSDELRRSTIGTCRLQCTAPSFHVSTSCCQATENLRACSLSEATKTTELETCKQALDASLAFNNQECSSITREDTALVSIMSAVLAILAVIALFVWSRRRRRRHNKENPVKRIVDDVDNENETVTPASEEHALVAWLHQVGTLVWKNLLLRRRRPVALVVEQVVPLLFVAALVVLANLDAIFGRDNERSAVYRSSSEAATLTADSPLICVGIASLTAADLGAPNGTMRSFYASGQSVLGLFFLLSFIKFVSSMTAAMVHEKEIKMREMMKIMGVSNSALLASWSVTNTLLSVPVVLVLAAMVKFGSVFPTAPYALVVLVFWSLNVATVAFAYALAPWFKKARTAAIVSVLLWILLFFPFFSVQPALVVGNKYAGALAPPTAFALAIDRLLREAQFGTGFAYSMTVRVQPTAFQGVPTASAMSVILLLDSLLLLLLGWYLEQVLPQQYGIRKPWNFLFTKRYWQPYTSKLPTIPWRQPPQNRPQHLASPSLFAIASPAIGDFTMVESPMINEYQPTRTVETPTVVPISDLAVVEPVNGELLQQEQSGASLQLRGLTKLFPSADGDAKLAVDALTLTFYSGQITSLLGHNGAGKTTTIAMLTGLVPPTSGDALLFGRSLRHDSDAFRRVMGVCPQHDVLFPELTVDEHLRFFASIKQLRGAKVDGQLTALLEDVGLLPSRGDLAKNLSGGQKRKLSVAIALLGDAKLVFLDEPTSGMDPYSRRFTWNLLRRKRSGRVLVLTTHFMDEADVLGDRIAILADGQLRCVGSSLFLKHRFGAGYNLTLLKDGSVDVDHVEEFLNEYTSDVALASDSGSELVFTLATSAAPCFPALLEALDANLSALGVRGYGVSVTTLEDVFLRIASDRDAGGHRGGSSTASLEPTTPTMELTMPTPRPPTPETRLSAAITRRPPFKAQVRTQLLKRWWIAKRDRKSLVNSVAVPLLFLLILALLPEVQVANFLPDYALTYPSASQQQSCPAAAITDNVLNGTMYNQCITRYFGFCSTGLVACDAAVCCNAVDPISPFYACPTCPPTPELQPCYNPTCLRRNGAKLQVALNGFIASMVVMLAFAFIPAALIAFIVKEKEPHQDAKTLQRISGMDIRAYWAANSAYDLALALASVVGAVVAIVVSRPTLRGDAAVFFVLVLAHALSLVPLTYVYARRFSNHASAQTSMLVFTLSSGGLLSIFSFLCRVIDFNMASSLTLSGLDRDFLRWLFMLFPGYALNNGVYELATRKLTRGSLYGGWRSNNAQSSFFGLFRGFGKDLNCVACWNRSQPGCCVRGAMDFDVVLAPVLYMLVEAAVFAWLVLRSEQQHLAKPSDRPQPRWIQRLSQWIQPLTHWIQVAVDWIRKRTLWIQTQPHWIQTLRRWITRMKTRVVSTVLKSKKKKEEADAAGDDDQLPQVTPQQHPEEDKAVVEGQEHEGDEVSDNGAIKLEDEEEEDDVVAERVRLDGYEDIGDAIELRRVHVEYPDGRVALQNLSLGIPRGECFGYLGVNGAGKSTTIKVLTRQLVATSGSVRVAGYDLQDATAQDEHLVGYCPQFDALHDLLTVDEQLTLYARLKGIAENEIDRHVDALITQLGLDEYRGKLTRGLSGGNKRKVSTAIALLGAPPIVILDEPSTGMDPSARRKMWNVIAAACADNKTSVVLTTHSMEECEALCSRVGILVQGKLQCLGSIQHLRHKYGNGYTVDVKLDSEPTPEQAEAVEQRVRGVLADLAVDSITESQLLSVCEALGKPQRADEMQQSHTSEWWSKERTMALPLLCAWWAAQDRNDALLQFIPDAFPGAKLVEQHGDHLRFHVPKALASGEELRPKAIFEALERGKQPYHIQEYSVSDTSLEHIFNRMAAEDDARHGDSGSDTLTTASE